MEQVKTKSVEPHTRFALPEVNWDELNEAGAYVERGSGDLPRAQGGHHPRRFTRNSQRERWIIASGASQQEPHV
jgi:hypothetical protein